MMSTKLPHDDWKPTKAGHRAERERIRAKSRLYIDSLATRFGELDDLARKAKDCHVFNAVEFAEFRLLFKTFREMSEEFQMLSHLTEAALDKFREDATVADDEHKRLDEYFVRMQVPVLHGVIRTNIRLLKIWDDLLQCGEKLPYGAHEMFVETLRIIFRARIELLRPCYANLLDAEALRDTDRVERLLDMLMQQAPKLLDFKPGRTDG
jgi:hypothetical protein